MAFIHLLFSSSILLLSLLASASDYDYVSESKPDYVKPQNVYNPKPQSDSVKLENEYDAKPRFDIRNPDTNYALKSKSYTAKPEETYIPKSESEYVKHTENTNFNFPKLKPEYVKPNEEYNPSPKPNIAKPDVTYPKLESQPEKLKPVVTYPQYQPQYAKSNKKYSPEFEQNTIKPEYAKPEENKYIPKSKLDASYPEQKSEYVKPDQDLQKPKVSIPNSSYGFNPKLENPLHIGIEGLVLCKSGSSYVPIKGAVAKISCSILGENGYMTRLFSCSTGASDAKGYFFKAIPVVGLKDCNVKLEKSSLESCNIPTDVNKGITGAQLSSYRILSDEKLKLYSVGPFFYTSESKPTPNTGY